MANVDVHIVMLMVSPQEVITRDNKTIKVTAAIYHDLRAIVDEQKEQ